MAPRAPCLKCSESCVCASSVDIPSLTNRPFEIRKILSRFSDRGATQSAFDSLDMGAVAKADGMVQDILEIGISNTAVL